MAIAIAAIRRAANSLRESRQTVNASALARILECSPSEMRRYIHKVYGLANEIGFVNGRLVSGNRERYLIAAAELREQKVPTTVTRLASHMQVSQRAVRAYLARHPDFKSQLGVVSQGAATVYRMRTRLDELAGGFKSAKGPRSSADR